MIEICIVADLNIHAWLDRLHLVTDPDEIAAILHGVGAPHSSYGCLLVEAQDGEYRNVFGCYAFPPLLSASVDHLREHDR